MTWMLRHKFLSLVIVVVAVVAAWYFLAGSGTPTPVLSTEALSQAPAGTENLVQSLLALRTVSLDGTIFSNPAFQTLQDFTTPITPEPVGRSDPFQPIGQNGPVSASSSHAAQLFAPAH